jgi:hypothetical protein
MDLKIGREMSVPGDREMAHHSASGIENRDLDVCRARHRECDNRLAANLAHHRFRGERDGRHFSRRQPSGNEERKECHAYLTMTSVPPGWV